MRVAASLSRTCGKAGASSAVRRGKTPGSSIRPDCKNGELVDLLSGGAEILDEQAAARLAAVQQPSLAEASLSHSLESCAPYRKPLADYMIREWNAQHGPDEQVVRLDVYYFSQAFDLAGTPGDMPA